ncbi:MAG: dihydrolipoyl dehydrogenase [Hadesarchaea archaeon]|nr:dihydrolipoyl dehydrogenase [Hadesarchaea archaeon]
MKEYDVLVVGSGSGMNIASKAVNKEMEVALVDKDPLGGTCMNRGCVPSKVMIYPADVIQEAKEAEKLGVNFPEPEINFEKIMKRTRNSYLPNREEMLESVKGVENLTYYDDVGEFTSDYTMKVSGEEITAEKIVLFSGSRPIIPPIKGLEEVEYLTNRNIFDLKEKPESLIIIGGGYIGVEFAHFFSSIGTNVTIIELMNHLLSGLDSEIIELLKEKLSSRLNILTNHKVVEVKEKDKEKMVIAENTETNETKEVKGESILVAAGRRSNADLLKVEKTGVETDEDGWIKVNDYLETSKERIWAGGDATGEHMFKHVANHEVEIAWHNAFADHNREVDYHAVPYAVFTHPQIAGVGLTVDEAKKDHDILVGKHKYKDTARGYAMGDVEGFCKIIVDKNEGEILGTHIIGPHASILIQEVINLMYAGDGTVRPLYDALHIHPALSEVVAWSLGNLSEVE